MPNETILDRLSVEYQQRKEKQSKAKKFAKGVIMTWLAIPTLWYLSTQIEKKAKNDDKERIRMLIESTQNQKDIDTIIKPYCRDHPEAIRLIPETYDSLQKLQSLLPKPFSITNRVSNPVVDTNTLVRMDGKSRVEIGTNMYFSQTPLQGKAVFIPQWKMIFDTGGNSLYTMNTEQQKLENLINEVRDVFTIKDEPYMTQGTSIFRREEEKFVKIYSGLRFCNTHRIRGTPYILASGGQATIILGDRFSGEERACKEDLEARIASCTRSSLANVKKVSFFENVLYICTEKEVVILSQDNKQENIAPVSENVRVIDYLPVPEKYESRAVLLLQAFKEKDWLGDVTTNYVFNLIKRTGDTLRTFAVEKESRYHLPQDPTHYDFEWIKPARLKAQVAYHLAMERTTNTHEATYGR